MLACLPCIILVPSVVPLINKFGVILLVFCVLLSFLCFSPQYHMVLKCCTCFWILDFWCLLLTSTILKRPKILHLAPTWWPTNICNFNITGPDTLFCPPYLPWCHKCGSCNMRSCLLVFCPARPPSCLIPKRIKRIKRSHWDLYKI